MKKLSQLISLKKIPIFIFLVILLVSSLVLYTPKPSNTENKFSAIRAQHYIKEISREPHSYYEREGHENVRKYLLDTLQKQVGVSNVSEMNYSVEKVKSTLTEEKDNNVRVEYPIENLLAVIPGKNKDGVLLAAHYDSRGHAGRLGELGRSYGAMDDGYGVSTMLELINLFKDQELENSIYFLFTDAEEVGLYGAKMASKETELMKNIKFVINLESRGSYGPAYMFETSKNNSKVIDLYRKANYPISYSLATAVYAVMPNSTDFTPFVQSGLQGINFAVLAGLDNYHTPFDSYEYIDLASVEHMGVQVEPILREFTSNSKYIQTDYFKSGTSSVFFTLLPNVFITYTPVVAYVLLALILIGLIVVLVIKIRDKEFEKKDFVKGLPKALLLGLAIILAGVVYSWIVAFIGKTTFKVTYTRVSGFDYVSLVFVVVMIAIVIRKMRNMNLNKVILSGVILNTFLLLVTTVLPLAQGASFVFMIPALLGLLALAVDYQDNKVLRNVVYVATYGINFILMIPIMYSLYMALTLGGIAILLTFILINGLVALPALIKQFRLN